MEPGQARVATSKEKGKEVQYVGKKEAFYNLFTHIEGKSTTCAILKLHSFGVIYVE